MEKGSMKTKEKNNFTYKIDNNSISIIEYSDNSCFISASYFLFKKKWNSKMGLTKKCYDRMNTYLQEHIEDLI